MPRGMYTRPSRPRQPCPYDDPSCTGVHEGAHLKAEWCPSAYTRKLEIARTRHNQRLKEPEYLNRQRANTRTFRRKRREFINAIKLESGCIDCGYNTHPDVLEFDHRPEVEKLFEIGSQVSRSTDLILAEIAKCDVRCANCHRIKTAERRLENAA